MQGYFSLIASAGHSPTHVPHSVHASWSIFATPSTIEMASEGQAPTHASQPVHSCSLITITVRPPFSADRKPTTFTIPAARFGPEGKATQRLDA